MNNTVLERLKQEYNETLNRMQDLGDILAHCAEMDTNHCGQDAGSPCGCSAVAYDPNESQPVDLDDACCQVREHQPAGYAYKDLLGMEVMFVFPRCHKCEYCTFREGHNGSECPCVKVELVGGDYLCLAKRPKQKQTIISFDEEEGNMMDDIKEKTEAFMNYLDSVVKD